MGNFDIIRFNLAGGKILIHANVTESQAREWCESEHTKGKKYFDGFVFTGTYCVGKKAKYKKYFTPDKDYH